MAQYDGEILINSKIDSSGMNEGISKIQSKSKDAAQAADDIAKGFKQVGKSAQKSAGDVDEIGESASGISDDIDKVKRSTEGIGDGFEDGAKGSQKFKSATEELENTIRSQESTLSELKRKYSDLVLSERDSGQEAEALQHDIQQLSSELQENKTKLSNAEKEASKFADELDDVGDSAEEAASDVDSAGKSFEGIRKTLAGGLVTGAKALVAGIAGITTAFLATGESSQEFREDMGKLETAFTTSGHTMETAKRTYTDFVGLLGETDQAVEASNHLAKLTQNTQELSDWSTIAAGVYATFGDSLPLEGLTEAANETARVGQVTGPLADALNWAGVSEDEFNKKLEACNSEQERATLITETLMGLYKEAGLTYQEVNADLIAAREANSNLSEAMAEVGALAMPITTAFKNMGANALKDLVPALTAVRDGFMAVFSGDVGGAEQLGAAIGGLLSNIASQVAAMLPTIATVGSSIVTTLATGLINGLPQLAAQGAQLLYSLAEGIRQNLPQLLPVALEAITSFSGSLRESVGTLFDAGLAVIMAIGQGIIASIPSLIESIPQIITNIAGIINDNAPKLLATGITLIGQLAIGLIQAIPTLIANIPNIIQAIVSVFTAYNWLNLGKQIITGLKNGISSMVGAVKTAASNVQQNIISAIQSLPSKLLTLGRNAISSMGNGIRGVAGLAKSAITTVANGIINAVKNVPSKMISIGRNIVQGIASGIRNAAGAVVSALGNVVNNAISSIKRKLGIASPSKVMKKEVGRWMPEGIAVGILGNAKSAIKAAQQVSGMISDAFSLTIPTDFAMPTLAKGTVMPNLSTGYMEMQQAEAMKTAFMDAIEELGEKGNRSVTYNQTFNSPKALSRREILRETKNVARRLQTV